jgi:hypothetical protein
MQQSDAQPTSPKLDELGKKAFSIKIPRVLVWRNPDDSQYYVIERDSNTTWRYYDRRGYRHSTSAYAKLGRIIQQQMNH